MPKDREFCWEANGKVLGMAVTEFMYFKEQGHRKYVRMVWRAESGGGGVGWVWEM